MKLKTLKDLDFNEFVAPNDEHAGREEFIRFRIKAEAIKWRKKKWQLTVDDWDEFFDITSEDLK